MDELQRQLRAFSQAYGQKGKAIVERIQQLMDGGMTVTQAVQQAFQEYDVADWLDANVSQAIVSTAQDALGAELAGALSSAELLKALSTPWDGSGMTLSQKLHGASREMRQSIVETVQNQIRRNSTVRKTAQALYDGYGYGHMTGTQELPRYLDELTRWARSSRESMTPADQLSVLKAIRKVKAQADGLADDRVTYNHFRTSLWELMDKLGHGSQKAAQRALQNAIQEKSRYVAERIARTEAARARYDAFIARYGEDEDVVAYQWKLGSRHPAEDICDMYAEADLYGLGKGIFPKDAAPVNPAHPHCLCHYAPVYRRELEGRKRSDNVEENGRAWLKTQSISAQEKILGVKGREEWKAGRAGWMEKARNFKMPSVIHASRLTKPIENGIINKRKNESATGKASAITHGFGELNVRQRNLLAVLPKFGSRVTVKKKGVKLGDLAAMTAATGVEFAVFTRKSERLVIRGNKNGVPGSIKELAELSRQGYRFSGHTHPGIGRNVLMASDGDYLALQQFHQKNSVIYNSQGQYQIYEKR